MKNIFLLYMIILLGIMYPPARGCGTAYPLPTGSTQASSVAFSPDGKLLATAVGAPCSIAIFTVANGVLNNGTSFTSDCVGDLTFSPSGNILIAGSNRGVYAFVVTGDTISEPIYYGHSAGNIELSPNGNYLVALNYDAASYCQHSFTTFQVQGNELNNPIDYLPSCSDTLNSLAFSPDGTNLFVANNTLSSTSSNLIQFPFVDGKPVLNGTSSFPLYGSGTPCSIGGPLQFSPLNTHCGAINMCDDNIYLYDYSQGNISPGKPYPLPKGSCGLRCLTFSPDGSLLATGNEGSNDITVFNVTTTLNNPVSYPLSSSYQTILDIAFSPDGHWLAVGTYNGFVIMFNTNNWCTDNTSPIHDGPHISSESNIDVSTSNTCDQKKIKIQKLLRTLPLIKKEKAKSP